VHDTLRKFVGAFTYDFTVVKVRICACPGRDRQIEERNAGTESQKRKPSTVPPPSTTAVADGGSDISDGPMPKRQQIGDDDDSVFVLSVGI